MSKLTKKRVEALLDLAGRGEDDLAAFWQDNWGVTIEGTDEEIRADVRATHGEVSIREAMAAANTIRAARSARVTLRERYLV